MSVITCRSNQLRGPRGQTPPASQQSVYTYLGGNRGDWAVTHATARRGEPLAGVTHVDIVNGSVARTPPGVAWMLSGLVHHTRYVTREDAGFPSRATQRPAASATCAALIAVRRSRASWDVMQAGRDDLLQPFPGLQVRRLLSTIIGRWQHPRDLSDQFETVTWFEYASHDAAAFDDLLAEWRASEEWSYVDRECELRLIRGGSPR